MGKKELLDQIEKNVLACQKCRLCQNTLNAVPGEGNIDSDIVLIGEAPGAEEDKQGRPFVGRAGKLLEKLLEEIGYKRSDVWIGNIIKHRPPSNRDPLDDEILMCEPFLTMQLDAIKPKLIVTLGRFAFNYFYKNGKISKDRGQLRRLKDYAIFPVYHPAAGLRNSGMLDDLRKDFMLIPSVLKTINEEKNLSRIVSSPSDQNQVGLGI